MSKSTNDELRAAVYLLTEYAKKLPEGYVIELRASAYYGGIWVLYYDGDDGDHCWDHHGEDWAAAVDLALKDSKRRAEQ